MKRVSLLILMLVSLLVPVEAFSASVTITYSCDTYGEILQCLWENKRLGGVARRATLINDVRKGYNNVFVVDAGNFLFHRISILPSSEEEERLKAELTARALSESGYDVVNVGPNDLAGGLDFLKEITKSRDFTLISANIISIDDLGFVFDPYVIVERGGVKVGFFGVMGGGVSGAHDVDTFVITDPIIAGKKAVGNLTGKCDLIVGLLATDRATANEFTEEVSGVDLIITLSQPSPIPVPVKVGKTTMVTADEKGKRIGRVTTNTGARPYTFKGEMIPAGTLVLRDPVVRKVENEYYYWMKEHNPGVIVPPSGN